MSLLRSFIQFMIVLICTGLLVFLYGPEAEASDKYWIKVMPTVTGPFKVDVEIETNIPGDILFSANLALSGQKPNDIFIGTESKKVFITNGKGWVTIDGDKDMFFSIDSQLPSGQYDVEVAFHHRWVENKSTAAKLGIKNSIEAKATLELKASRISVKEMREAKDKAMEPLLSKIKMLYHELMQFKNESKFHQYGFGVCCKYHEWLKKVKDLKKYPNQEQLVLQVGINATDLHLLGLEYMKSKGQDTDYTVFMNQEFKKALD